MGPDCLGRKKRGMEAFAIPCNSLFSPKVREEIFKKLEDLVIKKQTQDKDTVAIRQRIAGEKPDGVPDFVECQIQRHFNEIAEVSSFNINTYSFQIKFPIYIMDALKIFRTVHSLLLQLVGQG